MSIGADIETLARTLWAEARGEGYPGMLAVAWVVRNRVEDRRRWPNSYAGVCRQKWQFSCWNPSDPNLLKLQAVGLETEAFRDALTGSISVMVGDVADMTGGANHYLNPAALPALPGWYRAELVTATIGRHRFLRL